MENMRKDKDSRHHELENQFETHRRTTTETITSHTENITMLESLKLNLNS